MTDQMGVVYYGNYMELFEIGRTELFRSGGVDYREMESEGFMLPAIHASCDYLSPAKYDDLLEIDTRIKTLTRAKVEFIYEVRRRGEGGTLARGATHHVFMSREGKIRRLSAQWWERLRHMAEKHAVGE
ncbi:acyl-CoA thioesterase [Candidatus Sumerlaeota bacterium]|nr:acyl-CoA thioesterase [Candidatus Sumerlaeota bacterium]